MKLLMLMIITIGLLTAQVIDISSYNQLLKKYVDGDGFVDYAALKKNDNSALNKLVAQIAAKSPDSHPNAFPSKDHKLAYWINAYNILILKQIVDEYPTESIKDIYFPGARVWIQDHTVGGKDMSFNDIEHETIRKRWTEPRIHFAINCASFGCPKLQNEAITAENLEAKLSKGLSEFFDVKRNFHIDKSKKEIQLSSIFDWFKEDFYDADTGETILTYLLKHAPANIQAEINAVKDDYKITYIEYDWTLNDVVKKSKVSN